MTGVLTSIAASKTGNRLQEIADCIDQKSANSQLIKFEAELESKMNKNKDEALKLIKDFANKNNLNLTDKKFEGIKSKLFLLFNEMEYEKKFPETDAKKKHRAENFPAFYFQVIEQLKN